MQHRCQPKYTQNKNWAKYPQQNNSNKTLILTKQLKAKQMIPTSSGEQSTREQNKCFWSATRHTDYIANSICGIYLSVTGLSRQARHRDTRTALKRDLQHMENTATDFGILASSGSWCEDLLGKSKPYIRGLTAFAVLETGRRAAYIHCILNLSRTRMVGSGGASNTAFLSHPSMSLHPLWDQMSLFFCFVFLNLTYLK